MPSGPLKYAEELRQELARMKAKYDELADEVRAAIEAVEKDGQAPKLVLRRLRQRVTFGGRAWTNDEILQAAWEWSHRHGTSPTASDWNPALLRAKNGNREALERYLDGEWPSTATVVRHFGSWTAMLDAAELPHNDDKIGRGRTAESRVDGLPEWEGWEHVTHLRTRAGIPTYSDLARRCGLSFGTVRSIEEGEQRNPTIRVLLAIANGLGVRPEALL